MHSRPGAHLNKCPQEESHTIWPLSLLTTHLSSAAVKALYKGHERGAVRALGFVHTQHDVGVCRSCKPPS